jgi:hypothetical protein
MNNTEKKTLDQDKIASVAKFLYGHNNIHSLTPKQLAIVKACIKDKIL